MTLREEQKKLMKNLEESLEQATITQASLQASAKVEELQADCNTLVTLLRDAQSSHETFRLARAEECERFIAEVRHGQPVLSAG